MSSNTGHGGSDRIEMVSPEKFSDAQRVVYQKIVGGKRGKVVGPLRVALHSPELADRWQSLGEFLRYNTALPARITELAIITTGRFWNSQVEWVIHARIAEESGLSPNIIDSIRLAKAPEFIDRMEALTYEFTRQSLQFGQVEDATYSALLECIGTAAIVELTAVIGYYTMVALTLNIHRVPVPEDETAQPLNLEPSQGLAHPTSLPKVAMPDLETVR